MEFTLKYRSKIVIDAIGPFLSRDIKILDIGCGNGVVSHEIKKFFNCSLTGTDVLNYLIRDIDFKIMREKDTLDFEDKEYDVTLLIDVLHHVSFASQTKLIKEAQRVSKEVLIFEVKPSFLSKTVDYLINKIHCPGMPTPFTHRTKEDWIQLFNDNNINFSFHKVNKGSFCYPSTNYLFRLYG